MTKLNYQVPENKNDCLTGELVNIILTSPPQLATFTLTGDSKANDSLEVMLACCDFRYLKHADVAFPLEANWHTVVRFIEQHWINLQTLTIHGYDAILYLPICLRVCRQLQELKLENDVSEGTATGNDAFAPLSVPNTLPHLRSLSLHCYELTNQAIATLCSSSVAQQLTSLEIWNCSELSLQAYRMIARSFPLLEHFISRFQTRQMSRAVVGLLDVLFGEECAFAHTVQTLHLELFSSPDDWSKPEHKALAEELYHDHMVPHWTFPFPQLRSFSFDWTVNHHKMSQLIKQRLLHGHHPYLHSIKLTTHKYEQNERNLEIEGRPEVIRQLREKRCNKRKKLCG